MRDLSTAAKAPAAAAPAPGDEAEVRQAVPAEPAESLPETPVATWTTEDRGTSRAFILALDEAVIRDAEGKDVTVRIDPPATLPTLGERLRWLSPDGQALPVCYEPGWPRDEVHRRLVTRDITVQLPTPEAEPVLPAGVVLKERPSYAPGYAVVSAADPLAALAALAPLRAHPQIVSAEVQLAAQQQKRALPNDPLVGDEWHIKYQGQFGALPGCDVNVENVWQYGGTGGIRGNGVRIGIVDDGMQVTHPDLAPNADVANDFDWNGNDSDPSPSSVDDHGTACAGNSAGRGNNSIGVTGTAPEATLVGMRLIAAATTDSQEAAAVGYLPDIIQVKSNSWGPSDSGSLLSGPGSLARTALATSVANGRGGKGTVFLWASGNGLRNNDNSNYDGWANDIRVIAVTACDSEVQQSWYAEPGANILVCAPSSGNLLGVTTTDQVGTLGYSSGDYTEEFGGTSSATPTTAGIVALMLQKNPNLGYRDVQEILMRTATTIHASDPGWRTNAAGFDFNHKYGAGKVDATAAVNLAGTWTNLAASTTQTISQTALSLPIPDASPTGVSRTFNFTGPVMRVEHATVTLSAVHSYRGDLRVTLISPSGMESVLAETHSDSNNNYPSWTFSSVHHWGEDSTGNWTVRVSDGALDDVGTLSALSVSLQGTLGSGVNPGPSVQITSPAPGTGYSPGATVQVNVSASDVNGTGGAGSIASVELLDNGVSRGVDTVAPYQFSFQPGLGQHDLVAVATDSETAATTSSPVTIVVADQAPVITAASLNASGQGFADQPLTVMGVNSSDPEGQTVTLGYEWEKSADDETWEAAGGNAATLAPSPGNAGFLWRCRVTPSDPEKAGAPYVTSTVNLLTRPPASAPQGMPFSYDSGLVLRDADAPITRQALINEFSQGSTTGDPEWVELLTLRDGSLRNWRLSDASGNQLVFKDDAVWDNLQAGTLIVIYHGTAKDPLLPADDSDPAAGKLVLSSGNSAYFSNPWPLFNDAGDSVVLRDPSNVVIAGLSYGSASAYQPRLGNIAAGSAGYYLGGSATGSSAASGWKITGAQTTRGPVARAFGDLFFSEYVEGDSNTKWLEIYNPSPSSVDLAAQGYTVEIYQAGNSTPATPILLTGTVVSGDVFVVKHSGTGTSTPFDQLATLGFNGDDTVVLKKAGAVVDVIGQIGFDPGTHWGTTSVATRDMALRRKPAIRQGDTNATDSFDPTAEWTGHVSHLLGIHTIDPFLSISVNPASFPETAGIFAATGTITLSTNAPAGGLAVSLLSMDPTAATVPAQVTVPAGQTTATFNVSAVDDDNSDGNQSSLIVSSANGYSPGQFQVTVTDDEPSLEGVTPAAGNTQANTTYVANLRTGVYDGPSVFRFAASSHTPAGLVIDAATGLVSGSPTAAFGNYAMVIERFNATGDSVTQSFTLAIIDPNAGYPAWIAGFPGLSATGAGDDPDFDGMTNLLEYHLGGQPGTSDAAAHLPVFANAGATVTLTWWRSKQAAAHTTGTAEWSDTLGTWSTAGITTQVVADEPAREQVRATLAIGPGDTKKFLHLKVE